MITFLILLFGLVFGSFITAVSYRYPREIAFVKGRSYCPKCKKSISWYDNIPLLSFIILGGKCRQCKKPISFRYPLIEFSTALGFVLIYTFSASPITILYNLVIFLLLVLIFVIDMEHQIIPDDLVFLGIAVILVFSLVTNNRSLFTNLLGGFLVASSLMLINLATRGRGMGLGDVKFAVLGGLIVGLERVGIWIFLAFLTGGFVGIILILVRKAGLKDKIAFGPFLIVALLITVIWGEKIQRLLLLNY